MFENQDTKHSRFSRPDTIFAFSTILAAGRQMEVYGAHEGEKKIEKVLKTRQ